MLFAGFSTGWLLICHSFPCMLAGCRYIRKFFSFLACCTFLMLFACFSTGWLTVCYCFPYMAALCCLIIYCGEEISILRNGLPYFCTISVNAAFLCDHSDICLYRIDTLKHRDITFTYCFPAVLIIFQTDSDIISILHLLPGLCVTVISDKMRAIAIQIKRFSCFWIYLYAVVQSDLCRIFFYCVSINYGFCTPQRISICVFFF